ncbi:hypothetical protein DFQ28_001914 [Apophysomyces sp. BC1034]|nr:hypothetical protein DFQ30_002266 [Apophysomyces sp. BC1015]KAG0180019.1 hypothetical protein DFQ29_001323 [Apophysomyces sp. BC1021]KAG0190549.1 hypothetical protein DFQ28_001914 [Apophysomyces sp. BC1034]
MSSLPPKQSLSSPTSGNSPAHILPTPSSSTSGSARPSHVEHLRRELEQQLAEKEKLLQEANSGIGKNVLARQISQIQERLRDMDKAQQTQSKPLLGDDLPPATLEKLRNLERDLSNYRSHPLSPALSGVRKEKLLGQRSTGLDALPSPSNSTLLPPDPSSLLPLPPPPTGSTPTKRRSKVPNNDRRNTDIEFATEIGQGLLLEVRKMQALLQEKEEQLRALEIQKADLERTAEAMAKQLRQREENEEKLKEETWNLELAKQELTISVTDLQQNLSKANSEQNKLSKQLHEVRTEIEQLRDREEKLSATMDMMKTRHEHDMSVIRRHAAGLQREKSDQTKQIESLTSELAIAKAQSRITKHTQSDQQTSTCSEVSDDQVQDTLAIKKALTPNASPPPSPKQTPIRNQALEVETLKTSLAHAHRMVSNLRSNLHKEKTEKFEFKKLLAESQETIEQLQNDPRMWEDAGHARSGAGSSHDNGAVSAGQRRARKTKRRTAARKPRGLLRQKGDDDYSDLEGRRKRKDSQLENDSVYSYSSMSEEESEMSSESENERDQSMPKSLGASLAAAGFASLSSELSQSQPKRPILVDAQVNTDSIDILTPSATAHGAIDPKVPGIEISTQTDEPSPKAIQKDDHGIQTDEITHMTAFEVSNVFCADIAPAKRCDGETQCIQRQMFDAGVQSVTVVYVDGETQSDIPETVHAETQSEICITEDRETQCIPAPGVDQSSQSEVLLANSAMTQTESPVLPVAVDVEKETVHETHVSTGTDVGVQVAFENESKGTGLLASAVGALGLGILASKETGNLASVQDHESTQDDALRSNLSSYKTAQEVTLMEENSMPALSDNFKGLSSRDGSSQLRNLSSNHNVSSSGEVYDAKSVAGTKSLSSPAGDVAVTKESDTEFTQELHDVSSHVSIGNSDISAGAVNVHSIAKSSEETFTKSDVNAMIAAAVAEAIAKIQEENALANESRSLHEAARRYSRELGSDQITNGSDIKSTIVIDHASVSMSENDSIHSHQDPPPRPAGPPPASLLCKAGFATNSNISESHSLVSSSISKGKALVRSEMDDKTSSGFGMTSVHTKLRDERRVSGSASSLSTTNTNERRHSVSSLRLDNVPRTQNAPDSSLIQLVTQTMIGDWLWKYTRKTVGNGLSERRHQRFFWIHPYTRTLYWSTRVPGEDGKEMKAKSAFIESVKVIPDDSQSPSGLPNVSLLIQTGSRQIKVTAPDMNRHELWHESLAYLIARAGTDTNPDKQHVVRSPSTSLLRRPSLQHLQDMFQHGQSSVHSGHSGHSGSGIESESGFDHDSDDDELEDVRMCCDGKHHVSRLEKDHLHRHPYRKRRSRNTAQ